MDGPKGNLNFDTDDDGNVDSDDDYWNSGAGWDPIGEEDAPFTADFNGNRRTVSNLFIDRDRGIHQQPDNTPDEAHVDVERGQDSNSHEADVAVERIDQKSQEQTTENARL